MAKKSKITKSIIQQLFSLFKDTINNFKKIPILLQLIILLFAIMLAFKKDKFEGFENKSKAEITFFHMNGCGHCQRMKPEWNSFNNSWNDYDIVVNDKEHSKAANLCKKYNITGFPTIIFTVNGEVPENTQNQEHIYNGDRTSSSFKEWANEMKEKFLS